MSTPASAWGRTRQAPDMSGQDAVCAGLHRTAPRLLPSAQHARDAPARQAADRPAGSAGVVGGNRPRDRPVAAPPLIAAEATRAAAVAFPATPAGLQGTRRRRLTLRR